MHVEGECGDVVSLAHGLSSPLTGFIVSESPFPKLDCHYHFPLRRFRIALPRLDLCQKLYPHVGYYLVGFTGYAASTFRIWRF